jgi:hypothetical protein
MQRTRRTIGVVAASLAAVVGAGGAVAATKLTGPKAESQAIVNDAAARLGVDPAKLTDALQQAQIARVDAAVAAGTLTKAQGDALKQRITSGNAPLVETPTLHDRRGFGHHGGGFGPGVGADSKAVTDYLGITAAQLRTQLEAGKTLAQIATANGKSVAGLKDAITTAAKTRLDAAVKAGTLTQAQADQLQSRLTSSLDDLVNGTFDGHHGGFGGRGFGGPGAPDQAPSATDPTASYATGPFA